jgi:hypothetical protein
MPFNLLFFMNPFWRIELWFRMSPTLACWDLQMIHYSIYGFVTSTSKKNQRNWKKIDFQGSNSKVVHCSLPWDCKQVSSASEDLQHKRWFIPRFFFFWWFNANMEAFLLKMVTKSVF